MSNEKQKWGGVIFVCGIIMLTISIANFCTSQKLGASTEIGGNYSVTYQKCQRTTVEWGCGNCGKSCGKSTITWPKPNSSTTKRFKCSKCGKRNKVKLNGKKWPCD